MLLLRLAIANLRRNRRRSALTCAGVALAALGAFLAYGFVRFNYWGVAEGFIHAGNGHLQVARASWFGAADPETERVPRADLERVRAALKADTFLAAHVTETSLRRQLSGTLTGPRATETFTLGAGLEAASDLSSAVAVVRGEDLTPAKPLGVVLGEALAEAVGAKLGDFVSVMVATDAGQPNALDLEVVGFARSRSRDFDKSYLAVSLDTALALASSEQVDALIVGLDDTAFAEEAVARVSAALSSESGLAARGWWDVAAYYQAVKAIYDRLFGFVLTLLLALAALAIANTMLVAVAERRAEIAILRAVGGLSRQIVTIFVLEALILGFAGAVVGVAAAFALNVGLSFVGGIPMPPPPGMSKGYGLTFMLDLPAGTALVVVTLLTTGLAGWWPARAGAKAKLAPALAGMKE